MPARRRRARGAGTSSGARSGPPGLRSGARSRRRPVRAAGRAAPRARPPPRPARRAIDRIAGPELAWLARAYARRPPRPRRRPPTGARARRARAATPSRTCAPATRRPRAPPWSRASARRRADVREALVEALAVGLSVADESLPRSLPRRPGQRRPAGGAAPAAALGPFALRRPHGGAGAGGAGRRVEALPPRWHHAQPRRHLPEESPDLARDGVEPKPVGDAERRAPRGPAANILAQAPLSAFAEHPPALWITLALTSAWSEAVSMGSRARDPARRATRPGRTAWPTCSPRPMPSGSRRAPHQRTPRPLGAGPRPPARGGLGAPCHRVDRGAPDRGGPGHAGAGARALSRSRSARRTPRLARPRQPRLRVLRQTLAKGWIVERLGERLWPDARPPRRPPPSWPAFAKARAKGCAKGRAGACATSSPPSPKRWPCAPRCGPTSSPRPPQGNHRRMTSTNAV